MAASLAEQVIGTGSGTSATTSTALSGEAGLFVATIGIRSTQQVASLSGGGLTWTKVGEKTGDRNQVRSEVWRAQGTPSGSFSVTVNMGSSATTINLWVGRYIDFDTTTPIDEVAVAGTGGTDNSTPNIDHDASVNDTLLFLFLNSRNRDINSPDADYTQVANPVASSGGNEITVYLYHRSMPTAGSSAFDATLNNTADWTIIAFGIRPAVGGGGTTVGVEPLSNPTTVYEPSMSGGLAPQFEFEDDFNRTVSDGWGSSQGHDWEIVGGTGFSVDGKGRCEVADSTVRQIEIGDDVLELEDVVFQWEVDNIPAGGFHVMGIYVRRQDADNWIQHRWRVASSGAISFMQEYEIGGVQQDIEVFTAIGKTYTADEQWYLRVQVEGVAPNITIRARTWKSSDSEPSTWDMENVFDPGSTAIDSSGHIGYAFQGTTSGSQVIWPVTFSIDNIQADPTEGGSGQAVDAQLLDHDPSFFSPTVSPGGVSVVAQLLTDGRTIHSPTVEAVSSVVAQLLVNGRTLYPPDIAAVSEILAQLLSNPATAESPDVSSVNEVAAELIDNPASFNTPAIATISRVLAELLNNPATTYPSVVQASNLVEVGFIDSDESVPSPSIQMTVGMVLLSNVASLFEPAVSPGPVSVAAMLLVQSVTLQMPSIERGGVAVSTELIDHDADVHDPQVDSQYQVEVDALSQDIMVEAPTVSSVGAVVVPLLDVTSLIYEPDTIPGGVQVSAELLEQLAILYEPDVEEGAAPGQSVEIPVLDVAVAAYNPQVLAGIVTVQAHLLQSPPSVYAPGITQEQFVIAQLITRVVQTHSPDISSILRVLSETIDQSVSVHTPEAIPGGVVIQAGELVVITNVRSPRVFVGVIPTNYQWDAQSAFGSTKPASTGTADSDFQIGREDAPETGTDDLKRSL